MNRMMPRMWTPRFAWRRDSCRTTTCEFRQSERLVSQLGPRATAKKRVIFQKSSPQTSISRTGMMRVSLLTRIPSLVTYFSKHRFAFTYVSF